MWHSRRVTETKQQTILEQLGGLSGLIYSSLPIVVFVPANSLWGLAPAVWTALGVAAAILVWRLVKRGPIQPAISGFLGVGVCAFIAYRTGDAKGYFLFGIYTSLLYAAVFLVSILVRWPLVGVAWGYLNGHRNIWKSHKVRYAPTTSRRRRGRWCSGHATWSSPSCTTRIRRAGSQLRASAWDGRSPDSYSS